MPLINVGSENSADIELHYNDHGVGRPILPFELTTARLRDERPIADLTVVEIAEGPHAVGWTHTDEVSSALLSFLASEAGETAMAPVGRM